MNHEPTTMKKYILKPGIHQFAPGSPAVHNNDNLTDAEAEWYLQRYPHIAKLFVPRPPEGEAPEMLKDNMQIKKLKRVVNSTPPSGGKGGV